MKGADVETNVQLPMSRVPTVIYTHGGGRLGNQLIRFAHWLAWIEENQGKVSLVDVGFWPHAREFVHWADNRGCSYPHRRAWSNAMSRFLYGLPDSISRRAEWRLQHMIHAAGGACRGWQGVGSTERLAEIDLDSNEFLGKILSARVTTCAGWKIAGWNLFGRHEERIRELLTPHPHLESHARSFVGAIRNRADIVAGVLIRHGDYRTWSDGRFYFDTATYVQWMHRFVSLHAGSRVAFIVTSDEVQDQGAFAGLDVTFSTGSANVGGRAVDAMFELAACNDILAPPSTFAAWAAHWGRVPLWAIGRDELDSWRPVTGGLDAIRRDLVLSLVVQ